jgi:hypothetical protein
MRAGRFALRWGGGESAIEGAMHGIAISLVVPLHDRMQMSLSRTPKKMEGLIFSNHGVCSDCECTI